MKLKMANGDMATATARERIYNFPSKDDVSDQSELDPPEEISFLKRRAIDLGIYDKAMTTTSRPRTPEWKLNGTTLATWLVIIATILGGFWWSYQRGEQSGDERATQREKMAQQQKELDKQKTALEENEKLLKRALNLPDPTPSPKEK